jgi:hypothetical protein
LAASPFGVIRDLVPPPGHGEVVSFRDETEPHRLAWRDGNALRQRAAAVRRQDAIVKREVVIRNGVAEAKQVMSHMQQ